MAIRAMVFDVDGTLVDSNGVHVQVWQRVLSDRGYDVSVEAIGKQVGKGGDQFVKDLLGEEAERRDGEALRKAHSSEYIEAARKTRMAVYGGAVELLEELGRRKVTRVLATSSKQAECSATWRAAGKDFAKMCDVVVTADDAERSKPAPDLVEVAVGKAGVPKGECLMVGDTPYDVEAARKAGVRCVGVTSGGHNDAAKLQRAGAALVVKDVGELLTRIDEVLAM